MQIVFFFITSEKNKSTHTQKIYYYWLIDDDIYIFYIHFCFILLPILNGNSFDIRSVSWFVPEIIALQFKYNFLFCVYVCGKLNDINQFLYFDCVKDFSALLKRT